MMGWIRPMRTPDYSPGEQAAAGDGEMDYRQRVLRSTSETAGTAKSSSCVVTAQVPEATSRRSDRQAADHLIKQQPERFEEPLVVHAARVLRR